MKTLAILPFLALAIFSCHGSPANITRGDIQADEMWISTIAHGTPAFNPRPGDYQVFRNVMDFGCRGDGVTDDTACINTAISSGTRCGDNCGSSTLSPAIIYFPSGQYLISRPIIMYYFSQLIGNANDRPTLIMAPNFDGIGMLDSDPYSGGENQWYTNQNNFFRQVRNFNLDTTRRPANLASNCIHWQVAQATSLVNLHFKMTPNSQHVGVWMENGSGGFMSDLTFEGGLHGMWIGNQQFLTYNLKFENVETAIFIHWNWQWSFKNVEIRNCRVGIDMSVQGGDTEAGVGSAILFDSEIIDTPVGVRNHGNPNPKDNSGTLLLDNVRLVNVNQAVADRNGNTILAGGTTTIQSWGRGSYYVDESGTGSFHTGDLPVPQKSSNLLDGQGRFFTRSRPQYENVPASGFANVKDYGARGDGQNDDSNAIQEAINQNRNGKIVYFPHGSYVITKTINIPGGSKITGELWSILMASGNVFSDPNSPQPMLKVGDSGEVGSVELTELMFSTKGPAPGATLVQWNIKGDSQGSAGIWDCHFRVGGFAGTQLQYSQCPRGQGYVPQCAAAFMLLHVTAAGSGYFENVWAWTADHDLDNGLAQSQISIYTGRGVLVESQTGPVWLYGTQSEHNIFYQYQLDNAQNVFMTMIQGETPYWQPAPPAPEPFRPNPIYDDPSYDHCSGSSSTCRLAWGLRVVRSSNVYLYGAGLYNFFNNYDQTCLDFENCQDGMVTVEQNTRLYAYNINTKASSNIIMGANQKVIAKQQDNKSTFCQSVNAFLAQV